MSTGIPRRDFLKTVPGAAVMLSQALRTDLFAAPASASIRMEPFDYRGVRLRPSRWQEQSDVARDVYAGFSNDDILHGFRKAAGLPAPGAPLGGGCGQNSSTVFGQWLSGMSRMYRATGDVHMRDKAVELFTEWAKTVKPDGDCGIGHYPFDKLVCGLVDLKLYADPHDSSAYRPP